MAGKIATGVADFTLMLRIMKELLMDIPPNRHDTWLMWKSKKRFTAIAIMLGAWLRG